ncbi:glycosyltransferase [Egicoccus halophilus]|uniref:4,4'-diaponeurosporenoate glycosyltransferase n=1 Tax=Egicoccus halophilus TaxID=1670830 RepID=A0A8J3ADH7_9ACTN|nr:glycosyltransferase [Egicoccus halophilus]GGI05302.1 hypothetical protein GCM10011354_13420 [Egicoccus halophilus]
MSSGGSSSSGGSGPSASVVIPAHDEGAVIDRCLRVLLEDVRPGEFEVIVVCNGCGDDTAERARRHPGVRVEEIAEPSKQAALQRGDDVASVYPRIYLDADVQMHGRTARALAAELRERGLAGAPAPRFDASAASAAVRSYFGFLSRHPVYGAGYVGSGVFALTRAGRERFGPWPRDLPDDAFVQRLIPPQDRVRSPGTFVISTPRTMRAQLQRSVRIQRLNRRLERVDDASVSGSTTDSTRTFLLRHLRQPRWWPGAALFVLVAVVSRVLARLAERRGQDRWLRDETSRAA